MVTVLAASVTALGQGAPAKPPDAGGAASQGTSGAAAAPDPAFVEAAKHFDRGRAALEKKQYAEAVKELGLAYAVLPRAQIAGKLGEAELQLGRYRDAAEHLEKFLRDGGDQIIPAYRKSAEGWLATAKKNVATLKVTVTPPPGAAQGWDSGQEWLVDGVVSALKGPLPPEVFVEPGKRTVAVRAGAVRGEVTGEYLKGTKTEVTLAPKEVVVRPVASASASGAASVGPPSESGSIARPALLIAGGAAAVGLLATGAGLLFVTDGKTKDLETTVQRLKDAHGNFPCATPRRASEQACKSAEEDQAARNGMGNVAIGVLAAGGAMAAVTVAYLLIPSRSRSEKATLIVPFASANEGGAVVRGSF